MAMGYSPSADEDLRRKITGNQIKSKKMNQVAAEKFGPPPTGIFQPMPRTAAAPVPDVPTATAPKPVPTQQPAAGPVAVGASPMVPGVPVAGPSAIPTVNDVAGRKAALDQQINTILKTRVLPVQLGSPGRDEAVNYVRMLKAERDALGQSVPNMPKFLSPDEAEGKQRQMLAIRRAEVQRQLEAAGQPMSGADQDQATMNAGKMALWQRGMGDAVLRDTSGNLQREAGREFSPGQYVQSGGAYGTPGEKAVNADQIRRNQMQEQLRARLADIDREQGDLDSGKYKADYVGRQGQRDAASQAAQVRAAAAGAEADRMKGQRDMVTQAQMDEATMAKRQREIGMKMQEAQLAKAQAEADTMRATGAAGPILAKSQTDMARANAGYNAAGYENRGSFLNAARDAWNNLVKPSLGGMLDSDNVVTGEHFWSGAAHPEKVDQFSSMVVDPLESLARVSPDEAKIVARNILSLMPPNEFKGWNLAGAGRGDMAQRLNSLRARLTALANA